MGFFVFDLDILERALQGLHKSGPNEDSVLKENADLGSDCDVARQRRSLGGSLDVLGSHRMAQRYDAGPVHVPGTRLPHICASNAMALRRGETPSRQRQRTVSVFVGRAAVVLEHGAVDDVAEVLVHVDGHVVRHAHKQVHEERLLPVFSK